MQDDEKDEVTPGVDEEPEAKEAPKRVAKSKQSKPVLDPDHFASRQRAHDIKVANFLAGGEF